MKRKIIASVILLVTVTFLAWYMYQEYKNSQVTTVITATVIEETY